jgi:hypothetical protein
MTETTDGYRLLQLTFQTLDNLVKFIGVDIDLFALGIVGADAELPNHNFTVATSKAKGNGEEVLQVVQLGIAVEQLFAAEHGLVGLIQVFAALLFFLRWNFQTALGRGCWSEPGRRVERTLEVLRQRWEIIVTSGLGSWAADGLGNGGREFSS